MKKIMTAVTLAILLHSCDNRTPELPAQEKTNLVLNANLEKTLVQEEAKPKPAIEIPTQEPNPGDAVLNIRTPQRIMFEKPFLPRTPKPAPETPTQELSLDDAVLNIRTPRVMSWPMNLPRTPENIKKIEEVRKRQRELLEPKTSEQPQGD